MSYTKADFVDVTGHVGDPALHRVWTPRYEERDGYVVQVFEGGGFHVWNTFNGSISDERRFKEFEEAAEVLMTNPVFDPSSRHTSSLSLRYATVRQSAPRLRKQSSDYDSYAYNQGWATSERGSEGALDRADARNVKDEWYDGYFDHTNGRPKYYTRDNPDWESDPNSPYYQEPKPFDSSMFDLI